MDKDSKTSDGTTPPSIAHNIKSKPRTKDISPCENVDFAGLLLSQHVLDGLKNAGFERPSPIQLKAIPLGRCGLDLVVQAKSGTGKTCVFSVIALGNLNLNSVKTQVLVLAPTREIAVQIWEVINSLGCFIPGLKCHTFIGGLPIAEDKTRLQKCHIAVGTPGRVKQLIEERIFNTESIRLFILDEADKLLEDSFQETINWIYSSLSENKQMLALSATYPEAMAKHLTRYMRNPTYIRLNSEDPALLGIRQYMKAVPFHHLPQSIFKEKCKALMELLSFISFNQCLVFSNYQMRAQSLSDLLASKGWPSTYISGSQDQVSRLTAMAKLKTFQCRILISTDLTSRGIDAENVNLIVNLDLPRDHETYLHRIGRAGRFGSYGAAITLVTHGKELADLRSLEKQCNTRIKTLPEPIPSDLARSSGYVNIDDLVITETVANGARNAQTEGDTFIKSRGQDDTANQLTDTVGDTRDNYHQFNRNALELIRKETGPPDRGIPRETQSSESNAISLGTDHSLFKGTCMRYHNDCHVSFTSLMGSQLNFSSIDAVVKDKVEISKPKEIISLSKNYFSEAIVQVSQLLNELSLKRAELEEAKDIKKTVGREGFQVSPKEQFSSIASAERVEEQTLDIDNSLFDPVSVSIEDSRLEDRQLGLKYLERIHATSDNDSDDFTTISDLESDLDDNDHLYETGEDEHHSREQQPECNKYPYNAFETVDSDYMYAKDDLAEMQYHDYNTHDDYYHHNQDHSALGFNQFNSTYNAEQPEMVDAARENHAWRDCFHESIQYLEWLNRAHLSNYAQYCYHINHLHCQYASMYKDMYICASEKLNQLET